MRTLWRGMRAGWGRSSVVRKQGWEVVEEEEEEEEEQEEEVVVVEVEVALPAAGHKDRTIASLLHCWRTRRGGSLPHSSRSL